MVAIGLLSMNYLFASTEMVSLHAKHIRYYDHDRYLIASGDVEVVYHGLVVKASLIKLNTNTNELWASHNVVLQKEGKQYLPKRIYVDLDNEVARLEDLVVTTPMSNGNKAILKIAALTDKKVNKKSVQLLEKTRLTSCDLPVPHYNVYTREATFKPDEQVSGQDIWVSMPILGVPLIFWTPYYQYELGKRKIIWKKPVVGKRNVPGWGWYVQNTIEYDFVHEKESHILLDWFYGKGIGVGVQHQYEIGHNQDGTLMVYHLGEEDTSQQNNKLEWTHHIKINPEWDMSTQYKKVDSERFSSFGRENIELKSIQLTHEANKNTYKNRVEQTDDFNQKNQRIDLETSHFLDQKLTESIKFNQNTLFLTKRQDTFVEVFKAVDFVWGSTLQSNFNYRKIELWEDPEKGSQFLESHFHLQKSLSQEVAVEAKVDHLMDLNGERSSQATGTGINQFFYRLPEITVDYSPKLGDYQLSQKIILGRYQEINYDSQTNRIKRFPDDQDMGWGPNTFGLIQSISREIVYAKNASLSLSSGYTQYVFQNPGHDWFSGDAFYVINTTARNTIDTAGCLILETSVVNTQAPPENNSPYVYLNQTFQVQNALYQKINLYWQRPEYLSWSHETGYDWVMQQWRDYLTKLMFQPTPYTAFSASIGKKLNPTAFEKATEYYPLVLSVSILPHPPFFVKLGYDIALDTNAWISRKQWWVQSSRLAFDFNIGVNPLDRWEIGSAYVYRTTGQDEFDWQKYDLQLFQIVKRDHCRTFSFGYNKSTESFQFKISIDAFPDMPLEITQSRGFWNVGGGGFNQGTQERF